MLTRDYLMDEAERLTNFIAQVIFHKQAQEPVAGEEYVIRHNELLLAELLHLKGEGRLNEAEDRLFEVLYRDPSQCNLTVAGTFYREISLMDDLQLAEAGFPREEILEGMQAVRKIARDAGEEIFE